MRAVIAVPDYDGVRENVPVELEALPRARDQVTYRGRLYVVAHVKWALSDVPSRQDGVHLASAPRVMLDIA